MAEIRDRVRDKIGQYICENCPAVDTCTHSDFELCSEYNEMLDKILSIKELAVVNRDAKLPSIFNVNDDVIPTLAYKEKLQGYVQEEK